MTPEFDGATLRKEPGDSRLLAAIGVNLRPGTVIGGRYVVEELIGEGGFGEVYRAHDEMLGRAVALKTLPRAAAASSDLLAEAKTVAKLDHPHIVPVYDVGISAGTPWMAMKLVDGAGLDRVLIDEGKLDRDRAVEIAKQAASALSHAHRRGIVHRDIKPSNILISRRDDGAMHVWLADFGIAQILSGQASSGMNTIAGTPAYMAPEQITGRRVDARADIFALGCVIAEMLTGKRCFGGTSGSDLIYRIVHHEPESLSEIGELAGPEIERVIRRAMAKSPDDRYTSVDELSRELLSGGPAPRRLIPRLLRRRVAPEWDGRDVIVTRGLEKGYSRRDKIVRGVDLRVPRGSIFALLGPNGSGKTTLIRTLLGIYRRDAGEVRIFGRDPQQHGAAVLARVGFVADNLQVYDTLRVRDFLRFMNAAYPDWDDAVAYSMLGRYKFPLESRIKALSRGMRTQLALAGALAHKPELLVLDDPTLGLDAVVLDDFFETLSESARRQGTTIFIATHNIAEVETIATHIALFDEGKILFADSLRGIRTRMREVTLTFAGDVPDSVRAIPSFTSVQSTGRRVKGVVLDATAVTIDRLKALEPAEIDIRELTLKEIFVNTMKGRS
jgi:ABC-2 type transport system ATP-binding protein